MKKITVLFFVLFGYLQPIFAEVKNTQINLIWQSGGEMWEGDWIHELLSETNCNIIDIFDGKFEKVMNNSIVVISTLPDTRKYKRYFASFSKRAYNFGIIHLSDEAYHHPTDFYPYANFVLRNYWHKKFASQRNVMAFPLGYKREFWKNHPDKQIKRAMDRRYTWSFAGQIKKSTRESMFTNMSKIPNYHLHEIVGFAAPEGLSAENYRDLLLETIFMPCPRGWWNLDSFRLSEALECGCIPIVEKKPFDYFSKLFGQNPFIAVDSWDEVPAILNYYLSHPYELEQLQQECYSWWIEYKNWLKEKIAEVINSSFH